MFPASEQTAAGQGIVLGRKGGTLVSRRFPAQDNAGNAWIYEKNGVGATIHSPYRITTLVYEPIATARWSFFRKYGDLKMNLASSFDLNWAGITP